MYSDLDKNTIISFQQFPCFASLFKGKLFGKGYPFKGENKSSSVTNPLSPFTCSPLYSYLYFQVFGSWRFLIIFDLTNLFILDMRARFIYCGCLVRSLKIVVRILDHLIYCCVSPVDLGFECYEPLCSALQLTVTKIFTYIIYLYVFISVKTAPQLNRLSRIAQTVVTIRRALVLLQMI